MAWNGSNGGVQKPVDAKKSPSAWRGAGAGLLVVVSLIGGYLLCFPVARSSREVITATEKKSNLIKQATPEFDAAPAASRVKPNPSARPTRVGEYVNGYVMLPSGELHKVNSIITNGVEASNIVDKTFPSFADRMLGNLLLVEPGEGLLGSSEELYEDFEKEFVEAIKSEIKLTDEDTEETRELKIAVQDLRNELLRRYNAGEDITQAMIDTRNQLQELSVYRDDLEKQVLKISATTSDLTQKDYDDLLAAANEMLADRGVKPLEIPQTLRHAIRLQMMIKESEEDGLHE